MAQRGWVYRCSQCKQMTLFTDHVEAQFDETNWLCTQCETLNRLAEVPEEVKAVIKTAAQGAFLAAVKETRERLGWSLAESVDAVHALCDQTDASYQTPELQAKLEDFRRFVAEKRAQQASE